MNQCELCRHLNMNSFGILIKANIKDNIKKDFGIDINLYSEEKFTVNEEENKEFEEYLCNEDIPEIDFQKIIQKKSF